jgi:hypothetical protein
VAAFLNIPESSPVLEKILESMYWDDEWDEEDKVQKAYKMAGLKRYCLDDMWRTYSERNFNEQEKEEYGANTETKMPSASSGMLGLMGLAPASALGDDPSASSGVKVEFPLSIELRNLRVVMKACKSALLEN